MVAVVLGCLLRHLDAAIGHEGALQGLVGLQADYLLRLLKAHWKKLSMQI